MTQEPRDEASLFTHGRVSYLEIPAIDAEQSAAFYEQVFGWAIRRRDTDRAFEAPGNLIGRWMTGRAIAREAGVLPFIYAEHIDATVQALAAHGGEVINAPYPEGDLWVATFRDPAGNLMGIWQRGPRAD